MGKYKLMKKLVNKPIFLERVIKILYKINEPSTNPAESESLFSMSRLVKLEKIGNGVHYDVLAT